jgi:FMN phosphatase YigB (HAD superfamily)
VTDSPAEAHHDRRHILVLDFDGTVCVGDGLIWAYADGILPHLAPDVARGVSDQLSAYLAGQAPAAGYVDGYAAVAELAEPHLAAPVLHTAYADSRWALEDDELDAHAPDGLAELLDTVRFRARAVVVTNAPNTGLDVALKRLGLADAIDEVICSADKPARSAATLASLLDGADPATLMSVGDLWVNDIAPALQIGCATAFVDRAGRDPRPAHARGRTIQALYPAIDAWSRAPHEFVNTHRPSDGSTP